MKQHYKQIGIAALATLSFATGMSEAHADPAAPLIVPTSIEARYKPLGAKIGTYSCDIGAAIRLTKEQYSAGDLAEYLVDVFASCDVHGKRQPLPITDWDVHVYLAKKNALNDPSQHILWRTFTNSYPDGPHPVTEVEVDQIRHLPAAMEQGTWVAYTAGNIGVYLLQHASLDEFDIIGQQNKNFARGTTLAYSRDGIFKTTVTLPEQNDLAKVTMPGNFKIKFKPSLTEEEQAQGMHEDFRLCGARQYNGKEDKIGFYAAEQQCLSLEADEGKRIKIVGDKPAGWFMRLIRGTDARIATAMHKMLI